MDIISHSTPHQHAGIVDDGQRSVVTGYHVGDLLTGDATYADGLAHLLGQFGLQMDAVYAFGKKKLRANAQPIAVPERRRCIVQVAASSTVTSNR
jgi:hypothetical protein